LFLATRSQNLVALQAALKNAQVDESRSTRPSPRHRLTSKAKRVVDLASSTVVSLLIGTVSDPTKKRAGVAAQAIVAELEAFARARSLGPCGRVIGQGAGARVPLVLAGGALVTCEARVAGGQIPNLAACDISKEVDAFSD